VPDFKTLISKEEAKTKKMDFDLLPQCNGTPFLFYDFFFYIAAPIERIQVQKGLPQ
jgi:hypothetical protein